MGDDSDKLAADGDATEQPQLSIKAAVLDTCFYNKGNLDVNRVHGLADRLALHGIELWVPVQVTWEWAIHAYEIWTHIRSDLRTLAAGGFASAPETSDAVDLVESLADRVGGYDNVVILHPMGIPRLLRFATRCWERGLARRRKKFGPVRLTQPGSAMPSSTRPRPPGKL